MSLKCQSPNDCRESAKKLKSDLRYMIKDVDFEREQEIYLELR